MLTVRSEIRPLPLGRLHCNLALLKNNVHAREKHCGAIRSGDPQSGRSMNSDPRIDRISCTPVILRLTSLPNLTNTGAPLKYKISTTHATR
jgi:hypothetical protein